MLLWLVFSVLIITFLCVDLFLVSHGRSHRVSKKEALIWSLIWFFLAMSFNFFYWYYLKETQSLSLANVRATEFFTGYLIEKSLSVDNIFIFTLIFQYLVIPKEYQKRVLTYGVISAVLMRLVLIYLGLQLVTRFDWLFYVMGLFLLVTGVRLFTTPDKKPDFSQNKILQWIQHHLRITSHFEGDRFSIRQNKKRYFTPLFLALILIEMADLVFAIDSVPAIFAITKDPFVVFTSNIFAILGLRALYFLLADLHEQFHYLKYGLALILVLIGLKMILHNVLHVPPLLNLVVIAIILAVSISASIFSQRATRAR